jgi:copper chaperone CopZ
MFLFKKKGLIEYRLEIHGMKCGMCESHINDVIRKNFDVKRVKSNRFKNQTIILSKTALDEEKIKSVIAETGYELKEIRKWE